MLDCKTDQTQTRTFNKTKGSDQGNRYDDYRSKRQRVGLGSLKIKRHYDQIPSVNVVIHSLSSFLKHTHTHTQWALQRQSTVGFFKLSYVTVTYRFFWAI